MTNRAHTGLLVLVLGAVFAGCHGKRAAGPIAPTPVQPAEVGVQVAGSVSDAAWRPLAGARVEVVDGPQTGLSTTTDVAGGFRLAGAFDDTSRFRASKENHIAATWPLPQRCAPCDPDWWIHFNLETLAPHPNLAGDYTVTFIADRACTDLPDDVRTRTYGATVTLTSGSDEPEQHSRFTVTLTGATFLQNYVSFTIGVAGEVLGGFFGDLHGRPGLIEEIAPNTYLTLDGTLKGSATDGAISSSFYGVVDRCELPTAWGSRYNCSEGNAGRLARCSSQNHQLILVRR